MNKGSCGKHCLLCVLINIMKSFKLSPFFNLNEILLNVNGLNTIEEIQNSLRKEKAFANL